MILCCYYYNLTDNINLHIALRTAYQSSSDPYHKQSKAKQM